MNFGDPNMEIKRDDPGRRKNFRARHNCSNPGPKTKARYWSCKMWSKKSVTKVTKGEEENLEEPEESSEATEDYMKKPFMDHCASYDKDLVNTAGMDKDKTYAACAIQYDKMKSSLYEKGEAGLTEKQKKLPKPLQDAILKKQGGTSDAGLWENIQKKKKRMGKNYKAAKPGDKDYPSKEAIKKAQSKKMKKDYAKEDFEPHMMYDPKTGKGYKAKTLEDHLKMKKMGYTHEKPK